MASALPENTKKVKGCVCRHKEVLALRFSFRGLSRVFSASPSVTETLPHLQQLRFYFRRFKPTTINYARLATPPENSQLPRLLCHIHHHFLLLRLITHGLVCDCLRFCAGGFYSLGFSSTDFLLFLSGFQVSKMST